MTWNDHQTGKFPDISTRAEYQRLVALARRRLVGHEHHAEDVVSRALLKWVKIPAERSGVARIEQVIKSEAYSVLRSEYRARDRDTRAFGDRAVGLKHSVRPHTDLDMVELKRSLSETSERTGIHLSDRDIEVLELLFAGYSQSDIERDTTYSRHEVRRSRGVLQKLLKQMGDLDR